MKRGTSDMMLGLPCAAALVEHITQLMHEVAYSKQI